MGQLDFSGASCHLCQRYNKSKAIHNTQSRDINLLDVVTYVKDTINRKQFTTQKKILSPLLLLSLMSKIQ